MNSTALALAAARDCSPYLLARSGARLRLRPATPKDSPLLAEFFRRLAPEDLRFRFLDTGKPLGDAAIRAMLDVDQPRDKHILVFDTATGQLIASMMIIAEPEVGTAEVAIAVASEWKGRGIGWALLRHAKDMARAGGLRKLRSVELRANHSATDAERTLGFRPAEVDGDPGLVMMEADLV